MSDQYDNINPSHYKKGSMETIDQMVAIWGAEAVALHCEITAFKYRSRIGDKPGQKVEDELGKIKWYDDKAKELRLKISDTSFLVPIKKSDSEISNETTGSSRSNNLNLTDNNPAKLNTETRVSHELKINILSGKYGALFITQTPDGQLPPIISQDDRIQFTDNDIPEFIQGKDYYVNRKIPGGGCLRPGQFFLRTKTGDTNLDTQLNYINVSCIFFTS